MRSPRRRVTVVAHELRGFVPVGGMGTATTFLSLALARLGHSVEILLGVNRPEAIDPYWGEVYASAGVRFRAAPPLDERIEPPEFRHARSIELGLREDPPDVVVGHDFGAPLYTALRARQAGLGLDDTLFVVFCHGPRRYALDLSPNPAPADLEYVLATGVLEQAMVELADVVVSPSAYLLGWMRGEGWRLPERSVVIPYFTRSSAAGEPVHIRANDTGGPLRRLAFFGRLDEKKGLEPFAAGLNALEPELLQNVELELVGRTTSAWPRERVESLLSERTRHALRNVTFETGLDQHEALAHLSRPGTVVVMPSLQENSPNAVYECLEHGIPFVASAVGGVPELISTEERARVLFEPTAAGVEQALRGLLSAGTVPPAVRAAHTPEESLERWDDVAAMRPLRASRGIDPNVDVVTVRGGEALHGAREATAPFVLFLGADDVADDALVSTLTTAQAATDADVVTCGIHVVEDEKETLQLFAGEPGALGALANGYGSVELVRRSLLDEPVFPWGPQSDPAWPLLARLAAAGARIVSVPEPLVTRSVRPGTVDETPGDALLAVRELEAATPHSLRGAARLAAGLAADTAVEVEARRNRAIGIAVLALTLAAAAIRFSTLARQSYWYDELVTVSLLHRTFGGMLHAIPHSEATPYLYYVLAWPWARLFGFGEAGVRSLSALAGTLTVPVAYAAGAALVSRRVGLIVAALVAVNPFLVWYSQEARAYALFALAGAATLWFFARAWRGDSRALAGWAAASAVAVATQYFAVFLVAAEAALLLARYRVRAAIFAAIPCAVMLAELPLILKQRHNGANVSGSPLSHRLAGIPKDLVVGYSFPAELAGSAVAALLVLAGIALVVFAARGLPRRAAAVAGGIAVSAVAAPVLLAAAGSDYVIARNMISVLVPAAIFLAVGYSARRVGLAAAAVLCALSLAIAVAVAADTRYGRTDWRGAAHALGPTAGPRAIVATPTIDATLLRPYVTNLTEPPASRLRVATVDVVALASQGGFSTGAVHPPSGPPRRPPPGFRLVAVKRTPTLVLVRYRAPSARSVSTAALAGLALGAPPATVLVQGPTSDPPR